MRDHRIRRREGEAKPLLLERAAPARVPGVRLRRHRAARGRRPRLRPRRRQPPEPRRRCRAERLRLGARPRPHALGDARRRHRAERASAHRLRRDEARDRAQRDRRELPRAKGQLLAEGHTFSSETDAEVVVHMLEREYDGDLAAGACARVPAARGPLHDRRDPSRPARPARRCAVRDAARRRGREGRGVHRLVRRRVPRRDPARVLS